MNASRKTAGVTLIVTVLIVMLVMAAILAVTAQFSLATRRGSVDQENTLRAQYASESGVARSQAGLNLLNALMTNDLSIPIGTGSTEVASKVAALCGISGTLPANGMLCGTATPTASTGSVLGSTAELLASPNRLSLFTDYIPDAAYGSRGWTLGTTSGTNEQGFWANALGSAGLTGSGTVGSQSFSSAVRARVTGVQRLANDQYVVYFTVPSVQARGGDSASARAMTVNPVDSVYTLVVGRGSFAKYALFTNHHYSSSSAEGACTGSNVGSGSVGSVSSACDSARIYMTSNTLFSGPVHTNQNFTFTGSPYFGGQVTSAGCPAGQINSTGCGTATRAGAFDNDKFYSPGAMSANPPTVTVGNATPTFSEGVNWNADFIPMPQNGNDQVTAAKAGGLYMSGQVSDLALAVSTLSLGGTTRKAQTITYQQQVSGNTTTVSLAYGADGRMYIKNTSGAYVPARRVVSGGSSTGAWEVSPTGSAEVFNGVVYAEGGMSNLRGPARTSANDPGTAPPAVADFAQLTLASTGDIQITTDLKYENPPCGGGDATTAVCDNTSAKNILGIYSADGDVKIMSRYVCTKRDNGVCTGYAERTPSAPKDVTIQAVLMAGGQGSKVTVDGFDAGPTDAADRGRVNLLGGIIEDYYGAFGQVNGKGYGRNFVYDPRTSDGIAPPSFPTQKTWEVQLPVGQRLQLQGSGTQQAAQP